MANERRCVVDDDNVVQGIIIVDPDRLPVMKPGLRLEPYSMERQREYTLRRRTYGSIELVYLLRGLKEAGLIDKWRQLLHQRDFADEIAALRTISFDGPYLAEFKEFCGMGDEAYKDMAAAAFIAKKNSRRLK